MAFSLEEYCSRQKKKEADFLQIIVSGTGQLDWSMLLDVFGDFNLFFAMEKVFIAKDVPAAKQYFYVCGRLNEVLVKKFNDRFLDYGPYRYCYPFLSDDLEFLRRYADIAYKGDGKNIPDMDELVKEGGMPIYAHCIQMILKEDWEMLARDLDILERVTLPKEGGPLNKLDYAFYKAMLARDKSAVEGVISQLVSPKIHRQQNDDPILSKYISMPALGYAKLAWLKGIRVEVDSPLVPKELLPVEPLAHYTDTYDFLIQNQY